MEMTARLGLKGQQKGLPNVALIRRNGDDSPVGIESLIFEPQSQTGPSSKWR